MRRVLLYCIATTVATIICLPTQAQTTDELFRTSNQQYTLSTARSAAMGGAFTSLGADPVSMILNPAGLAMYSQSEASITPSLMFNKTSTNTTNGTYSHNTTENNTKLALTNLVTTLKFGNFVLGVGYNRVADSKSEIKYDGPFKENGSIGQLYANQLSGITDVDISAPKDNIYRAFYSFPPTIWDAITAYQSGLVNADKNYNNRYNMNGLFSAGDTQRPGTRIRNKHVLDESNISGAYNLHDKLYFGVTLGVQTGNIDQSYEYYEIADNANNGSLDQMTLRKGHSISTLGFNMKVGVTARPAPWVRIGVAYHSPTWNTYDENSYSNMTTFLFNVERAGYADSPQLVSDYNARTPSRLNAGVSFTIAKRIIVSADYERVWYGNMKYNTTLNEYGMRLQNNSNIIENLPNTGDYTNPLNRNIALNTQIEENYKAANNFRLGVEAHVWNGIFLRAGVNYQGSPYNDNILSINSADALKDFGVTSTKDLRKYGEQIAYSGGIGYRRAKWGIDITYLHHQSHMLPSKSYYYNSLDNLGNKNTIQSELTSLVKNELGQLMMTFSFRFGQLGY